MPKVAFKSSTNLLKAVIVKQAGDFRKGIKELVQNSIDAAYLKKVQPEIAIKVGPYDGCPEHPEADVLYYRDNGGGLGNSMAAVQRNFAVFGDSLKAGNDDLLGKFGMGRGQTISMIYDPEMDKLNGTISISSFGKRSFHLNNFRVDQELSFDIKEIENPENRSGTVWRIVSYAPRFRHKGIQDYVENDFMLTFPITVNDKPIMAKPEGKKVELDDAVIYMKDTGDGFYLYERGLFVKTEWIFDGFSGSILTKKPLNLNFARNDVLSDTRWKNIRDAVKKMCLDWFHNKAESKDITELKQCGLLNHIIENPAEAEKYADVPCVPLANGKKATLGELAGQQHIYEAVKGNRIADDLLVSGNIVIDSSKDMSNHLRTILASRGTPVMPVAETPEYTNRYYREVVPDGQETQILSYMNNVWKDMCFSREIKLGETSVSSVLAWTDGETNIIFNRSYFRKLINLFTAEEPWRFWVAAAFVLAHELAHNHSDESTDIHGPEFDASFGVILGQVLESISKYDFMSRNDPAMKEGLWVKQRTI